ncbi:MAG TPA: VapB-type antitoxin [Candidatus Korarchaeota archaeon]|nr:VapB-type antitoxin [Candidatus Korarchaeota archaeon]
MSETIRVSKGTKERLIRLAARLQQERGRKVSLDEAIRFLLDGDRKPELLKSLFGSVPGLRVRDLYEERMRDEERHSRRYGL